MNYQPDYDTAIRHAADSFVERMPSTPEGWGLLALAIIGLWFVCMVVMIVADALCEYCTQKRDEHEMSSEVMD